MRLHPRETSSIRAPLALSPTLYLFFHLPLTYSFGLHNALSCHASSSKSSRSCGTLHIASWTRRTWLLLQFPSTTTCGVQKERESCSSIPLLNPSVTRAMSSPLMLRQSSDFLTTGSLANSAERASAVMHQAAPWPWAISIRTPQTSCLASSHASWMGTERLA